MVTFKAVLRNSLESLLSENLYYQLLDTYIKNIQPLVYAGNQVSCPICGGKFHKFLPAGDAVRRDNATCPKCLSVERHRLLWLYLNNKTNFLTDKLRVLHFAPEPWFVDIFKRLKNLEYMTADLDPNLAMIGFDMMDIPFKDNYFDVILCSHVLEHVPDANKAMSELYRVLKPNGWAILQVPIDMSREETLEDPSIITPEDRERFYWQHDHVRLFGRDYKNKLANVGFQVKVDDYVKSFGSEKIKIYGLQDSEDIYLCSKK
jgi:SAM-dependent methyltransferase